MTTAEKEALVDLLNAHSNKILAAMKFGGQMPGWMFENHERGIASVEREFLADPEEITT